MADPWIPKEYLKSCLLASGLRVIRFRCDFASIQDTKTDVSSIIGLHLPLIMMGQSTFFFFFSSFFFFLLSSNVPNRQQNCWTLSLGTDNLRQTQSSTIPVWEVIPRYYLDKFSDYRPGETGLQLNPVGNLSVARVPSWSSPSWCQLPRLVQDCQSCQVSEPA